jgi:type I restriction enzyme S subunit
VALGELMSTKTGSVDPSKYEDEVFDLYSIPAYDRGAPEVAEGSTIGSSKQIVQPRDVLLSKIVPHIRRTWVVGEDRGRRLIASGEWIVFRSPRAEPEYLRQVLRSDPFHVQFMKTVAGVGGSLLRARPAQVARIEIPLPPLPEQRRIAAILDQADALRAKRREALAQLDSLTQSIFIEMFGNANEQSSRWPQVALGELFTLKNGINFSAEQRGHGILTVDVANMYSSDIYIKTKSLYRVDIAVSEDRILKRGDLLFVRSSVKQEGVAWPAIFGGLEEPATYCGFLIRARPSRADTQFDFRYLVHYLRQPQIRQSLISRAGKVAITNINQEALSALKISVPPFDTQSEFGRRVAKLEAIRDDHLRSLQSLDALFASLQHRAFAGQLS